MRRATHVADSPFRVAASQADDAREETGERAGTRQAVVVHAQSEIAVSAGGVGGEQTAIDVAHRLRISGRGVAVAVLLALPRPIAECRSQPEVSRRPGRGTRAGQGYTEQRVDALQREVSGVEGGCPPDVRARLEHRRRGIGRRARGQRREVGCRAFEVTAIQRIETGAQGRQRIGGPKTGGRRALQREQDRRKHRHVSGGR